MRSAGAVDGIGWREAFARYRVHVALGAPLAVATLLVPAIAPWLAAGPRSGCWWRQDSRSSRRGGRWGRRIAGAGLFAIPEERAADLDAPPLAAALAA